MDLIDESVQMIMLQSICKEGSDLIDYSIPT